MMISISISGLFVGGLEITSLKDIVKRKRIEKKILRSIFTENQL